MFQKYTIEIETQMVSFYSSLPERERRHYAAIEALKLPRGGQKYIQDLLGIRSTTLKRATDELLYPERLKSPLPTVKQRRDGGGRKKKTVKYPNIETQLHALIDCHKAGSPTRPDVYWIHLKPREIVALFLAEYQIAISTSLVKRELRKLGYRYRKISKSLATGESKDRDAQFKVIFDLILIISVKNPILSIDCKKKERLGTIYRDGKSYGQAPQEAYDHDYSHLGDGKIVPHGIYDMHQNKGFISIGNSSETAAFIIDNLLWWWDNYGIHDYPDADKIVLLCDAGGGNSYRHHAFKKALQALATEIGIDIIVAHYPPYASKWNPIEHRLFCHVHQAMSGQMFKDYDAVQAIISNTTTTTGLTVVVRLNLKEYQTGLKTDKTEINQDKLKRHHLLPNLNYRIVA